jgi:hypothetical protein
VKKNVGTTDKVLRVVLGLALLSYVALGSGSLRFIGLVGIIPLLTALAGYCPVYTLFGLSTCPAKKGT